MRKACSKIRERNLEIIRLFKDECKDSYEIASKFDITERSVRSVLHRFNVSMRRKPIYHKTISKENEAAIIKKYKDGVPFKIIYREHPGLDRWNFVRILEKNGIKRDRYQYLNIEEWSEEDKENFLKDYAAAMPLAEIQEKYALGSYKVTRSLLMALGYLPTRIHHELDENGTDVDCFGRRVTKKRALKKHWDIDVDMMKIFK